MTQPEPIAKVIMAELAIVWGFLAFMGACIGSFLTLATYRLPRDMKIGGRERSRCPSCGTTLGLLDLIPVLSWVLSGGRCRHCKTRVSIRYPLTELACAAGTVVAFQHYGVTLMGLAFAGLWWSVIAIIVTDLEHTIILDEVQIAVVLFGALFHYAVGTDPLSVLMAAALGLALGLAIKYGFLWIRKKDGLGLGDVKFLFGAGVWLADPMLFVPFLFYAGLLGVVFGSLWRISKRGEIFPFGPALAFSLFVCVGWPQAAQQFWRLYGMN